MSETETISQEGLNALVITTVLPQLEQQNVSCNHYFVSYTKSFSKCIHCGVVS